jgi:glycerol-3-phosphate acyltransferase PlsY
MTVELAVLLIGAYLLGAIPFGVLVARANGIDIMSIGSGNIGATNVLRVLDKGPAFLVFALDVLKGLAPALVARWLFPGQQELWFLAGMMAVVGHSLSPFLRFKGGKGISTALGMCIGTSPFVALVAFTLFVILLMAIRYMSVASMIAVTATVPMEIAFHGSPWVIGGYVALTVFVIYRHRANIQRLRNGTEPKFALKKTLDVKPKDDEDEGGAAVGASVGPTIPPRSGGARNMPPEDGAAS